jgi:type II secretory pathway component GspD/PulD (secretin)
VLGWLFRSNLKQTNPNRELVIFLTPSILRRDAPRASLQPTTGSAQR